MFMAFSPRQARCAEDGRTGGCLRQSSASMVVIVIYIYGCVARCTAVIQRPPIKLEEKPGVEGGVRWSA